jgi:hypothetical protein
LHPAVRFAYAVAGLAMGVINAVDVYTETGSVLAAVGTLVATAPINAGGAYLAANSSRQAAVGVGAAMGALNNMHTGQVTRATRGESAYPDLGDAIPGAVGGMIGQIIGSRMISQSVEAHISVEGIVLITLPRSLLADKATEMAVEEAIEDWQKDGHTVVGLVVETYEDTGDDAGDSGGNIDQFVPEILPGGGCGTCQ